MNQEIQIDVTINIKSDKYDLELTKEEAKKLREALDKALKTEGDVNNIQEWEKLKEQLFPNKNKPLPFSDPFYPRPFQPWWEVVPQYIPSFTSDKVFCQQIPYEAKIGYESTSPF